MRSTIEGLVIFLFMIFPFIVITIAGGFLEININKDYYDEYQIQKERANVLEERLERQCPVVECNNNRNIDFIVGFIVAGLAFFILFGDEIKEARKNRRKR